MKTILIILSLIAIHLTTSAQLLGDDEQAPQTEIYTKGLRFCEGTVPYRNLMLVSNFGGKELNPMNTDGKGYIMAIGPDGVKSSYIVPDGNLSAPKGMAVVDHFLYIADVNKVVVYNLKQLHLRPRIIKFPSDDLFLNDIAQLGGMIIVSVTNTGRIYGIDVSSPDKVSQQTPQLIGNVPGANGLAVVDNMIYIASYNPSEKPDEQNVIYAYDMYASSNPMRKLITDLTPGQYDGIAISPDGTTLFFTSWNNINDEGAALYSYNLNGKGKARKVALGIDFKGPADISIKGNTLWVPDLPASTVYAIPL